MGGLNLLVNFGWFEPVGEDVEVSVREIMKERIVTLRNAALTMHGWRNIIDNGDVDNICDAPFIINIKRKCQFLSKALSVLYIDRKKSNIVHMSWKDCCKLAIQTIKETEICEFDNDEIVKKHNNKNLWICKRTLMQWFRDFRLNKEKFINIPKKRSLIDRLPPIFDMNPGLKDRFISYAKENLVNLSAELMFEFVNDKLIPDLIEQDRREMEDNTLTREMVLKQYRI